MGTRHACVFALLAAALVLTAPLHAQRVLLLPAGGQTGAASFGVEPFASANTFSVGAGAFSAFSNPAATRYYVVSSSNIAVVDSAGNPISGSPFLVGGALSPFSSSIADACITPDGSKVLVAAGTSSTRLYVFNSQTMAQLAAIDVAGTALDVIGSMDSGTAYVLTTSGLTPVNLSTNSAGALLPLDGLGAPRSQIVQAPNGYLYINADSALYEIDTIDVSLRKTISVPGFPSKPTITPDLKAIMANPAASSRTMNSVVVVNLLDGSTVAGLQYFGPMFTRLVQARNGVFYALASSNSVLYQLDSSLGGIAEATFAGGVRISGALDVFTSNEMPTDGSNANVPKYLFVVSTTGIYRIDLDPPVDATNDQIVKTLSLPSGVHPFSGVFLSPASVNAPSSYILYGNDQTVVDGKKPAPLVLQAIDAFGKPTSGTVVNFSSGSGILTKAMTGTNSQGFAQAVTRAPGVSETITVTATLPAISVIYFNLRGVAQSGGGGGGGDEQPTSTGISILSGQGQGMLGTFQVPEPIVLKVTDKSGTAVAGQQVSVTALGGAGVGGAVVNGCQATSGSIICNTDADGKVTLAITNPSVSDLTTSWIQSQITAAINDSTVERQSVVVYATGFPEHLYGGQLQTGRVQALTFLTPGLDGTVTAAAGETKLAAVKTMVQAQSGPFQGQPIPNLGTWVRRTRFYCADATISDECATAINTPIAQCAGGVVLSGADGIATCDLAVDKKAEPGTYDMYAIVAGNSAVHFLLTVTPPPVVTPVLTSVSAVSGDSQTGAVNSTLPQRLVAVVKDQNSAVMSGVTVAWSVVSGSATLVTPTSTASETNGQASTGVKFGATAGPVQVRITATAGSVTKSYTFNLTASATIGDIVKLSGDGQSVSFGQAFAPISVKVTDSSGAALANQNVTFTVTAGVASPNSTTQATDANGVASASFTAGSTAGTVTIAASVAGLVKSVPFNLTVIQPGPQLTPDSFMNGASFQPGVAFGAVVAIKGTGLTTGLNLPAGVCLSPITDGLLERGLPTTLAGMQIQFGSQAAPIFSICRNADNSEQVNVQAPFELAPTTNGFVVVKTGVGTAAQLDTYVNGVRILNAQPGIFEYNVDASSKYAIAIRPDGSIVSPSNPARKGETVTLYVTGLGPALPLLHTNQIGGGGQTPFFPVSVFVNGVGMPGVNAVYAPGKIGMFTVSFTVPSDATSGSTLPLTVWVTADGNQVASRTSRIAIQ